MAGPAYPTPTHARAAQAVVEHFSNRAETRAVVLVNSLARGRGTPDSDLDMLVLVAPGDDVSDLRASWERFRVTDSRIIGLLATGPLSALHLDIEEGVIPVPDHPADEYPDAFELMIGNWLARGVALWERDGFHQRLRRQWLPYYDDSLRARRLAEVRACCVEQLDYIPGYIERGLHFQAFARLWRGFQLFLQALFINRRIYPIAYDKWVHEQVVDILELPDLYAHLPNLFEIRKFESDEVAAKAAHLRYLLDQYVPVFSAYRDTY